MTRVVFDIETLGFPFDSLDEVQQEYLLKFAKSDEERQDAMQKMALSPLTGQVLAVGMVNPDTDQGRVYHQGKESRQELSADGLVEFVPMEEAEILREFWRTIPHFNQVITFNGRGFDGPFLMLRSAILGIRPTRNLVPYRYSHADHCDLLDQLTFYGATRKFSLDFYCRAFGIRSPKSEGISGEDMETLASAGRYREIAEYCLGDVRATAELFRRWVGMLAFEK
jgi:DNA polymerase elongation subunit (family B)